MKLHDVKERLQVSKSDLSGSELDDVNLSGCNIHNVNLSGASLDDVNMSGWRVNNVNLSGLRLTNANLAGASISASRYSGMTIDGIPVSEMIAAYKAARGVWERMMTTDKLAPLWRAATLLARLDMAAGVLIGCRLVRLAELALT